MQLTSQVLGLYEKLVELNSEMKIDGMSFWVLWERAFFGVVFRWTSPARKGKEWKRNRIQRSANGTGALTVLVKQRS